MYYEKCKSKHNVEFFTWFEKYRPKSRELITKYVEKLKEIIAEEKCNEDESEEEDNNPNSLSPPPGLKMVSRPTLVSQPTMNYLKFLQPEIDDFGMV
jgi:hypothetical protein